MESPIRRVVVLGASSGIGATLFQDSLERGRTVIGAARRMEKIEEVLQRVANARGRAVHFDLGEYMEGTKLDQLFQAGPADLFINSAGLIRHDTDLTEPDTRAAFMGVNLHAPVALMRAIGEHYLAPGGTIIQVSSSAATEFRRDLEIDPDTGLPRWKVAGRLHPGFPGEGAYCLSKYELSAATEKYDVELIERGKGQRAFALEPGLVRTEEAMKQFPDDPDIDWEMVPGPEVIAGFLETLLAHRDGQTAIQPIETYRF